MINFVEEVCDWNIDRDNTQYSNRLEYHMLDEEMEEYLASIMHGNPVDEADALADIAVVAIGGLLKLCDGNKDKVDDILLAVTAANNTKSATKDINGKITKPANFIGPEGMIKEILDDC